MSGRRKIVKISEAEWVIMNVLWEGMKEYPDGMTLGTIVKKLSKKADWCHTTIRTMIVRLADKGAVEVEKSTGSYRYLPVPEKETTVAQETDAFVARVYDGSYIRLIRRIAESGVLTREEKEEIRNMF